MNKGWFEPRHTQHPRRQGGVMSESCTYLWSITATSATIHNADPNCPAHGQGKRTITRYWIMRNSCNETLGKPENIPKLRKAIDRTWKHMNEHGYRTYQQAQEAQRNFCNDNEGLPEEFPILQEIVALLPVIDVAAIESNSGDAESIPAYKRYTYDIEVRQNA